MPGDDASGYTGADDGDRHDVASLAATLVELTAHLRRVGAPVSSNDIGDALNGLIALGHGADDELIGAVLSATVGKYSARMGVPGASGVRSDVCPPAEKPSPPTDPTGARSQGSPFGHDDDGRPRGQQTLSSATAPAGTEAANTEHGDAPTGADASLGDATADAGTSRPVGTDTTGGSPAAVAHRTTRSQMRPFSPAWRPAIDARRGDDGPDRRREVQLAARMVLRSLDGAASPPRPARTGTIDVAATVRDAMKPGGSLLAVRHCRAGRSRPKAFVLVDVSNSVRSASTTWLAVAAAMARTSRHVRVAAISDHAVEVTAALRAPLPPDQLLAAVAGLGSDPSALSDWGSSFLELADGVGRWRLRHRHLIVMGDGRGNGRPPMPEALAVLTARSASSWWITSEPPGAWTLGDAEPARYRDVVDRMTTARTLAALISTARSTTR